MTFNIRYGTAPDGENSWPHRKEMVLDVLRAYKPEILGMQEALHEQLAEILKEFPEYASVGVGREADGGGEYSPLVYDCTRFDVLQAETFWLSETPAVRASKTWGNEITRICTWARLLDRTSNLVLRVYNTHWDHRSQPSRLCSGKLLARKICEVRTTEPLIVMGDFNVGPLDTARQPLRKIGLRDSFVDIYPDEARAGTFHEFNGVSESDKIDAILVCPVWQVLGAEIIRTERAGRFPSDHFPVTATLRLKAAE
jgi:endonuclease/exonuclease/phosphatase family metal-dependent hydrolase